MLHLSFLLWSGILLVSVCEQETKSPPYQIPVPNGWSKETISLPPSFAPNMNWQGTEELRFAPNWMKADSDTFFSYTMLFWLPENQMTDAKTMERELLAYYRGLAKAVSEGKKQQLNVMEFSMTIKKAQTKTARRKSGEEVTAYVGELKWIEPFTTGKPLTLYMEIHVWHCLKHKCRCMFICASPKAQTAEVWKLLRDIREGCTHP